MVKGRAAAFMPLALAGMLLGTGFVIGYGFRSGAPGGGSENRVAPAVPAQTAPVVKGLHASPDGKRLAFTLVYRRSEKGTVILYDMASGRWSAMDSPDGWQDFVTQWRADGRALLVEREKIPRPAAEARAGLYLAPLTPEAGADQAPGVADLEPLTRGLDLQGNKITTGFLAPDGGLIVKTRREPKALFRVRDGELQQLDAAETTYGQNRVVNENGRTVIYVVRDFPGRKDAVGLFRVENGKARLLGPAWTGVDWSYVAENGRHIIVARQNADGEQWDWELYNIGPQNLQLAASATLPGDIITVYWSPDGKSVLGAAGDSLWRVDIPSLKFTQLGPRTDWHADDVTWMPGTQEAVVAASGKLWRVDTVNGKASLLWDIPSDYWK